MSRVEQAPLLEILIARDEADKPCSDDDEFDDGQLISDGDRTAASFTAGTSCKAAAKKGILKRGHALRRASSLTAGKWHSHA